MRLSRQFQTCLFFFYQKILNAQKHKSIQTNQQNKKSEQKTTKATIFGTQKLLRGVLVLFLCSKSLRKKNKQAWNGPDNLICNTTALSCLCKFSCFTGMFSLTYMHRLLPKLSLSMSKHPTPSKTELTIWKGVVNFIFWY